MLGYIKGKILQAENGVVLLENGGVGYEIVCSASVYAKLLNEGEGEVYTYLAVREDDISLYGFVSPEEKKMFLKLTSVSGVGPKMGIGILSAMNLGQLAVAIATADVRTLSSVKGLGKKTAERIVLELKEHGYTNGKVNISHCGNPAAAERLMHMVKAVFEGAQVRVTECGGLCSYYAELGGLMVGFEDADA